MKNSVTTTALKTCESPVDRTCNIGCTSAGGKNGAKTQPPLNKANDRCSLSCEGDCAAARMKTIDKVNKAKLMGFKFPALVKRLEKDLKLSSEDAETLFLDMLKYLYLAGTSDRSFSPPPMIDEAWHTFIIFTQDYQKFCFGYFGRFIHHVPFTEEHQPSGEQRPIRPYAYRMFGKLSKFWPKESSQDCEDCAPVACEHR